MKGDQKRGAPTTRRRGVLRGQENDAPGYSDYEEDVTNARRLQLAGLKAANARTTRL
jgi:hypothetical protein